MLGLGLGLGLGPTRLGLGGLGLEPTGLGLGLGLGLSGLDYITDSNQWTLRKDCQLPLSFVGKHVSTV